MTSNQFNIWDTLSRSLIHCKYTDWPLWNIYISNCNGSLLFWVDCFLPLSATRLVRTLLWVTLWTSYKKQELFTIHDHPSSPLFFLLMVFVLLIFLAFCAVYFLLVFFFFCIVCHRSVSCSRVSGLTFLACPSGFSKVYWTSYIVLKTSTRFNCAVSLYLLLLCCNVTLIFKPTDKGCVCFF